MKKFGLFLIILLQSATMSAQEVAFSPAPVADDGVAQAKRMGTVDAELMRAAKQDKNILNHLDIGVNVGTTGIGINVAAPIGNYVRVRVGYDYMPNFKFKSDFNIETAKGGKTINFYEKFSDKLNNINSYLGKYPFVNINSPYFEEERALMEYYNSGKMDVKENVTMSMKPNLHQFKFLVDVLPFKNNKHWSFTAGFYIGPSKVGEANNQDSEEIILRAVNLYNNRYYKDYIMNEMNINYVDDNGVRHDIELNSLTNFVKDNGMAGFSLGRFKDDGRKALMVPGKDATARAVMEVSKIRPYLGFGYNTNLSKDKKWKFNVDAGVLFLCGAPKVYVDNVYKIDTSSIRFDENGNYVSGIGTDADGYYYGDIVRWNPNEYKYEECGEKLDHVDMINDLVDVPGKVGDMVDLVSKFKVYPNASVTFSYRLF